MYANKKIKNKQHITITIDTEVYLKIRLAEDINLSGLINDFLKGYFQSEEESEKQLLEELKEIDKKKILLEYEVEKRKANREKEQEKKLTEEQQERENLIRSIPVGNDFYAKLERSKLLKEHPELKQEIERAGGV